MPKPMMRRAFMGQAGATATVIAAASSTPVATLAASNPDPTHIQRRYRGWTVRPSGHDDHDNLAWALNHTPMGGFVKLTSGTFRIGSPILVPDFDGTLMGSGKTRTTITCLDEQNYELWDAGGNQGPEPQQFPLGETGAPTKTPPNFFQFYKTPPKPGEHPAHRRNRIVVKDFRCRGAMQGAPWIFGNEVLCVNILNSTDWHEPDKVQVTTPQDVVIANLEVDGYRSASFSDAFGDFENACACITILGSPILTADYDGSGKTGDDNAMSITNGGLLNVIPASGNVSFLNNTFRNCRLGPGVVGYENGTVKFLGNETDRCRGNCLQLIDLGNMDVIIDRNDLFCDSFSIAGEPGNPIPSSLGCVVAIQGFFAALGNPSNVRYAELAGETGTYRPQGPAALPRRPSRYVIAKNDCVSSATPNTYCYHLADLGNLLGSPLMTAILRGNRCESSETCIGLDHVVHARIVNNTCDGRNFGIELHDTGRVNISNNDYGPSIECEIRKLAKGDKLDLARVTDGAGECIQAG